MRKKTINRIARLALLAACIHVISGINDQPPKMATYGRDEKMPDNEGGRKA